jgi:hypothetical protein
MTETAATTATRSHRYKRSHNYKRLSVVGGAIAGVLVLSGAAFAYWTTSGGGVGAATTRTGSAVSVAQVGTVTNMAPGGAVQNVDFSLTNADATPQYITSATIAITGITYTAAAGAGNGTTQLNHPLGYNAVTAGCAATDDPTTGNFTIVQPGLGTAANTLFGFEVPGSATAGGVTTYTQVANGNTSKGGRISMNNLATNQDACKGTTVALSFTVA